ncbi:uncharacterized protein LOC120218891 [Hibiscus syriacus]|uniref:uncharacterized protein LOC120218891 n=1 Tax=Hibiscus syriacus TaxID=106335 RepID=UPI001924FA05|nr:uncharacterized protein LOC120218891 [Hibiscus syriacus]
MMMLGRGQEDLKSQKTELPGDISGKLDVLLMDSDDGSELSFERLVEEDKVEEIMQELYKEITLATSSSNTYPPSTISESCGASMSDLSSTVMAGIEFVGPTKKMPDIKGGLPETGNGSSDNELRIMKMGFDDNNNVVIGGGGKGEADKMEVDDDQWLARVLGWGPLELEEWT